MKIIARCCLPALCVLVCASCMTVNRLDSYVLEGARMAPIIEAPLYAQVDLARGDLSGSEDNAVLAFIELGADIAVSVQEVRLQQRINRILTGEELTIAMETEFIPSAASLLGAMTVTEPMSSDYLFIAEVKKFGLTTHGGGRIYLNIVVNSRIIDNRSGRVVWRRQLRVDEPASPSFFGVNDYIGTAISIGIIQELDDQDLARGLRMLSEQAASTLAYQFQRDYYSSQRRR